MRVCSPDPKISSGRCPGEHLVDQIGHRVGEARLGLGHLARAIGAPRATDRVREAVLGVRRPAVHLPRELREPVRRQRHRAARRVVLRCRKHLRAIEHHRRGDVEEALDLEVERRPNHGVAHGAVRLHGVLRAALHLRRAMPPALTATWITWVQPSIAARLGRRAQVAGVHLAPLPHPLRRRHLVRDAHLVGRVRQQVPCDGGAYRAGSTRDEDPAAAPRASEGDRGGVAGAPAGAHRGEG